MRNWIESISHKLGFTLTESKIIFFILIFFALGLSVRYFKNKAAHSDYLEFDYSAEDSLFNSALGNLEIDEETAKEYNGKKVASKNELLDFGNKESEVVQESNSFSAAININTAGINELSKLPGIGIKTAENILAYKTKIGKFSNTEQLLNIKGIGKAKLAKLRKLIKFE